jgi:signal transduction histidine kinase
MTSRTQGKRQKDEFLSLVSHELKTPLTSMTLFLQMLENSLNGSATPQQKLLIAKLKKQMGKTVALINNVLDVSKLQEGQLPFAMTTFSLHQLVTEVVDTVQSMTVTHKIEILGRTDKNIHADRERIGQVLINLLLNAVKYSPNAKKVVVKYATTYDTILISIRDFGIGIAKEDQKKIFDRFFRARTERHETYPGFGLGLYISQTIAKKHHGTVLVKSTKGKGSIFSLVLPAVD